MVGLVGDFTLDATASSGLSVSFSATGSCTVSNTVQAAGVGPCITASQEGLGAYDIAATAPKPWFAAPNVSRTSSIVYPFTGFSQPIDNGDMNVAQLQFKK